MRLSIFLYCIISFAGNAFAQDRPVLQWQQNYGGSLSDEATAFIRLPDGNFILLGTTKSNDGDISGLHGTLGATDIAVIKISPAGNIIWQKTYGGSSGDIAANIIQTSDGGFIFIGSTSSKDGDVSGNHGSGAAGTTDIWVVKLDAAGNILWQKCYGGTGQEDGTDILETAGGFMIAGNVRSTDGDAVGLHGIHQDVWIIRTGPTGNIIWQRCYGGTEQDVIFPEADHSIRQTLDGNFIIAATTFSNDGDVSALPPQHASDAWIVKITPAGSIIWDKCFGGVYSDQFDEIILNSDGSFFMSGYAYSDDLPGSYVSNISNGDGWATQLDAAGNMQWLTVFGGTNFDGIYDAVKTTDGGYLLTGTTQSADGNVCQKHLLNDMWLVKLDAAGTLQWNRTYGGSKTDYGQRLLLTPSNECYVFSTAASADGDIANNKGGNDMWLTKFSLTGPPSFPSVTISSKTDSILCKGNTMQFAATAVEGGSSPAYQWKLNGMNVAGNSSTIRLSSLQNNDVVSCVLTSNSSCVEVRNANSNDIKIKADPLFPPQNFLPKDTALCSFQKIELGDRSSRFKSYLWSDGSSTPAITVKKTGVYWLEVTDRFQCVGRDSITIFPKTCIEGIFVPNAFTPDKNGKNDLFRPIMNADVKDYRFIVYNRWGQIIFETTTLNKGWDGTVKNIPENSGVFIWQCIYQLEGEAPASKRGTVLLLR